MVEKGKEEVEIQETFEPAPRGSFKIIPVNVSSW